MRHHTCALLLVIAAAGCGNPTGNGDGSTDDAAMVFDASTRSPDLSVVATGADLSARPDLTALADLTASPDLSTVICGGFAGRPCGAGLFCQTDPGRCCCDFQGVCQAPPLACGKNLAPVCGCDGKTYDNDCLRQRAGVSQDHVGACGFACGKATCTADQVCFQGCCGAAGCMPPPPTCNAAPMGCNGKPTCACIPMGPTQSCKDLPGGGVLVTQMLCP